MSAASLEVAENRLWVVEGNGSPRSGKGTITNHLARTHAGGAQDETGADYRAVTFGLIADDLLQPDMTADEVLSVIEAVGLEEVTDYAARRQEIDTKELYTPEVSGIVSEVSPHKLIRQAVKDGFAIRVKTRVDDEETQILFVDGRNLDTVIRKVQGADLLLRLYVDCEPHVAANREAARSGIDLDHPLSVDWYKKQVNDIKQRQANDEKRREDPVKVDPEAIKYWFNGDAIEETIMRIVENRGVSYLRAARMIAGADGEHYRSGGRYGVGAKATAESRQVYFDTTDIGRDEMLTLASRMVDEALNEQAGRYVPSFEGLITI